MHLDIEKCNLARGSHSPDSGNACVMELVSCLSGDTWSDRPKCVSPAIAAFLRRWNDSLPDDERQILKQLIPVVMNTATTADDELRRGWMSMDWLIRTYTASWLELAGLNAQADALRQSQEITTAEQLAEVMPSLITARDSASKARDAAGAAAWDAARAAAGDAAWDAARAAAWDAARAAAGDAARAAAGDAAWDAAGAAAGAAALAAAGAAALAAAGDAAWAAAGDAAGEKLRPTVASLQSSALELVKRMAQAGR